MLSGSDHLDQPLPMPNFTLSSATAAAGASPRSMPNTSTTDGNEALAKDKGGSHSRALDPTLPELPQSPSAGSSALPYALKVRHVRAVFDYGIDADT